MIPINPNNVIRQTNQTRSPTGSLTPLPPPPPPLPDPMKPQPQIYIFLINYRFRPDNDQLLRQVLSARPSILPRAQN